MKYNIKLNEEQMEVMSKALDFYSRIGIGQLEEVVNMLKWSQHPNIEKLFAEGNRHNVDAAEKLCDELKLLLFNMSSNTSHGIGSPEVPNEYKVARDMNHTIRHFLYKEHDGNRGGIFAHDSISFGAQPKLEIARNES